MSKKDDVVEITRIPNGKWEVKIHKKNKTKTIIVDGFPYKYVNK